MGRARLIGALGGLLGLSGVVLAALGSHAMPGMELAANYRSWQAASLVHLTHAVLLAALAQQAGRGASRLVLPAALAIFVGAVLFAGSIYARIALGAEHTFNLAPAGGLLLMGGWLLYLAALLFHAGR